MDAAYRKLLRTSIDELVEIAVVLDEPVDGEYALALVKLGQRSRTLFAGIRRLHASRTPLAARPLLRPMIDINILVRFLRRDPILHTALWTIEAERSTVTMHQEVMGSPELRGRLGEDPLSVEEAAARATDVAMIRAVGVAAGLPIKKGSLIPSLPAQLKVIDEPAANSAYAFGFRIGSWDVHTGARAFIVGDREERNDGSASYVEHNAKPNWSLLLFATTTLSSTVELVTAELGYKIASTDARAIRERLIGNTTEGSAPI